MKTTKVCGIYRIRNSINGRVYIGSSVDCEKRVAVHRYLLMRSKHWSRHLQSAWAKYGDAAFVFEVVEIVEDANFILPREQFWIWRENAHKVGYNTLERPDRLSGFRHSAESLAKMSAAHKGAPSPMKGRKWSKAQCAAVSLTRRGKKQSPELVRKKADGQRGLKRSDESRLRMSAAQKLAYAEGRQKHKPIEWTPELRARLSARRIGMKFSAETRARISTAVSKRDSSLVAKSVESMARANRGRVRSEAERRKTSAAIKAWWAQRIAAAA